MVSTLHKSQTNRYRHDNKRQQIFTTTHNRMLRAINGMKDRVSTKSMLNKFDLLSVNQLEAKIKLIEVWKSINETGFPLTLDSYKPHNTDQSRNLRQKPNRVFDDMCRLHKSESSFHIDEARL
jgi:hypothetical protein